MFGDLKDKKWTLEEGLKECAEMENGKKHMTEDYIVSIGTIRPCVECGKPVDVVTYRGYSLDWMAITHCEEHEKGVEDMFKPPFKKCTDKSCEFHKHFDEERYYNESMKTRQTIKDVKNLINEVKPQNDSIMEYDRLHELFGHCHPRMKPDDYDFWLYNEFINYCGLNGKLRVRSGRE